MSNPIYSVITGDITSSSKTDRTLLLKDLKEVLNQIASYQQKEGIKSNFELYRGDSFQGIIVKPEEALKYALLIRAHLKKANGATDRDARIAIGIGTINFPASHVAEADGEAFRNSGPLLDTMKNGVRIKLHTPWKAVNEEMEVALVLADTIIKRWSIPQAEVVAQILDNATQIEIAERLGISQSAVNQRLKAAHWEAIEKLLHRFRELITKSTQKI